MPTIFPCIGRSQMFAREGVHLNRSTLAHWVGFAAAELEPLHARLVEILKASPKLFADETTCPVLDPGRGRTKTGYLWAIARDDRPWGGTDPPAVAYLYAPGRGGEHAVRHLAGFSGILHSNTVERAIRPINLNRKNALFAGSDEGGANWAIIASLIETCKLNGLHPHAWLTDTLPKLDNLLPASRIDELMPWDYPKAASSDVNV